MRSGHLSWPPVAPHSTAPDDPGRSRHHRARRVLPGCGSAPRVAAL